MGTPDFASGVLEALLHSEYEVAAVFTQPDRPKGRGGAVQMSPVKELAVKAGIPVYQPRKIRTPDNIEILREIAPDMIVVAAFGQIIPKDILDIPPYGCINVHASLLPRWRGAAPIQWSLIAGDKETGVTIMHMAEGLDTGDMISKAVLPITKEDTGGSLFDKLTKIGGELLVSTMGDLFAGTAAREPQPEESPTPYAAMFRRDSGEIDWTKGAEEIERLIRGLNPWPSAYTHYQGKMLKLWRADALPQDGGAAAGAGAQAAADAQGTQGSSAAVSADGMVPGTIIAVGKDSFDVATGDGILRVLEVQAEGKKRMETGAYLRGHAIRPGEILTGG